MSRMVGRLPKFEKVCESILYSHCSAWANRVTCFYDGSEYSKRDFCVYASHNWGTTYCYWNRKRELLEKLREAGATNIIGIYSWNRIELYFDIKKSRIKDYQ